jgi:chaperonin GroES
MLDISKVDLSKIIMIGDRVLVKPKSAIDRTNTGLFLPPGVQEKESLQLGYVLKVGPGYPIPANYDDDQTWKSQTDQVKYVPVQPKEGDVAVFLQKSSYEVEIAKEKYYIVSNASILMLLRDDGLFE